MRSPRGLWFRRPPTLVKALGMPITIKRTDLLGQRRDLLGNVPVANMSRPTLFHEVRRLATGRSMSFASVGRGRACPRVKAGVGNLPRMNCWESYRGDVAVFNSTVAECITCFRNPQRVPRRFFRSPRTFRPQGLVCGTLSDLST